MEGRSHTPEERALKRQARELGIQFHPRMGAERLRALIQEHTQKGSETASQAVVDEAVGEPQVEATKPVQSFSGSEKGLYMTEEEYERKRFGEAKRNANRLVRVRITCMDPTKKNWTGEIISVGSSKLGTYKKFIPFNSEEPYHIPWIIYQELKERKCRVGTTVKLPNGQEVNKYKLVNAFSIELLPPLRPDELEDLKKQQALAKGL